MNTDDLMLKIMGYSIPKPTYINVGKNRIKSNEIEWFKLFSVCDDRVVGKKGNFLFIHYGKYSTNKEEFNPKRINESEYVNQFNFVPISSRQLKIVPIK
jgi:hypothetical protein